MRPQLSREDHFKLSTIQKIYLQKKERSVFILYAICIQITDIKGLDFEIYRVFVIKRVFRPL